MTALRKIALAASALLAITAAASFAQSESADTYQDIQKTFGFVPAFFKAFPEQGIAGAWDEMKSFQMNPKTALPPKTKELIGLAVAAQIPCRYCDYFHTQFAKADGASDQELKEAIAVSAITRHWSTVLNGMQIDMPQFQQEVNKMFHVSNAQAGQSGSGRTGAMGQAGQGRSPSQPTRAQTGAGQTGSGQTGMQGQTGSGQTGMQGQTGSGQTGMQGQTGSGQTGQAGSQPGTTGGSTANITDATSAYQDMQATLGMVPTFMKRFPQQGIAGAWREFKTLEMTDTALDVKTKSLIGLAVAAQVPCTYCVYFHTAQARQAGANDEEIADAVAMSAMTRHWSTVLNGSMLDENAFHRDVDRILRDMKKSTQAARK
ncbi:MAG: hypothetical protein JWO36_805 [Myxococcales bacterium]|nr:hypothetical protein [Myxococcales bacterium]